MNKRLSVGYDNGWNDGVRARVGEVFQEGRLAGIAESVAFLRDVYSLDMIPTDLERTLGTTVAKPGPADLLQNEEPSNAPDGELIRAKPVEHSCDGGFIPGSRWGSTNGESGGSLCPFCHAPKPKPVEQATAAVCKDWCGVETPRCTHASAAVRRQPEACARIRRRGIWRSSGGVVQMNPHPRTCICVACIADREAQRKFGATAERLRIRKAQARSVKFLQSFAARWGGNYERDHLQAIDRATRAPRRKARGK